MGKSILSKMRKLGEMAKMDSRGQTLNLIAGTVVGFMVLIFIIFAVLFGINALNPSSFFAAGSNERNATSNLTSQLTSGISTFSGNIPTVMIILGVVLALSAIVLLVLYIRRMQGAAGGGSGGL